MKGNINYIIPERKYGFIYADDQSSVFFHSSDLLNCKFTDLYEGDRVEFEIKETEKGLQAVSIRKIGGIQIGQDGEIHPGINPMAQFDYFTTQEKQIINKLSKILYITYGGQQINIGNSNYKYCLAKPTNTFSEQFNIYREIVIVFSDYVSFEPRSLDAASHVILNTLRSPLRIERICNVLISSENDVETKVRNLLKNDLNMQVVVPFSYQEFFEKTFNEDLMVNRFRDFFFDRDLFAQSAPIQKDLYFFGRRDYVQGLINRAISSEHSGVFGLRRSGKTSVLYAIERSLSRQNYMSLLIDCQKVHLYRWNELLFYLLKEISIKLKKDIYYSESDFSEKQATRLFHEGMTAILENRLILLFDEIEHLTFDISMSEHWKNGKDFVLFWQAIRSYYQTNPNKISLIIAGTNPKINETPIINGYDNPMYQQLTSGTYLPAFDLLHTSEMVKKLGGYMGLIFEDDVCSFLQDDFGGHPFLIRRICSSINRYINQNNFKKPCNINKLIYNKVKEDFIHTESDRFCDLILFVLTQSYIEEYNVLKQLANDGNIKNADYTILSHLLGYNIVTETNGIYDFKIDIIKEYLKKKFKYDKKNLSIEEKWAEISIRRNKIEILLRRIIKTQLLSIYNKQIASAKVISCMESNCQQKAKKLQYEELFDPNKNNLYFKDLSKIISSNWNCFANIFGKKQLTIGQLNIINELRVDCHAKQISETEFCAFRSAMAWLEEILAPYI